MTYVITDACIGVVGEACIVVCPQHCIHNEPGDLMSFIDPARCIDCGVCAAACVVGAIKADHSLAAADLEFTELNAQWFTRRNGVRERVRELARAAGLWLEERPATQAQIDAR